MKKTVLVITSILLSATNIFGQSEALGEKLTVIGKIKVSGRPTSVSPLNLWIQFRPVDSTNWQILVQRTLGVNDKFSTDLPGPGIVSIQIATIDPTLYSKESQADFYTLISGKSVTIFTREVNVQRGQRKFDIGTIRLRSGSAILLCRPTYSGGGAVELVRTDIRSSSSLVYSYLSTKLLQGVWIGGLKPGSYDITYLGNNDEILTKYNRSLKMGQAFSDTCNPQ